MLTLIKTTVTANFYITVLLAQALGVIGLCKLHLARGSALLRSEQGAESKGLRKGEKHDGERDLYVLGSSERICPLNLSCWPSQTNALNKCPIHRQQHAPEA